MGIISDNHNDDTMLCSIVTNFWVMSTEISVAGHSRRTSEGALASD